LEVAVEPEHTGSTLYAWFAQKGLAPVSILDIFKLYLHTYAGAIKCIPAAETCEILIKGYIPEEFWQTIRKFKKDTEVIG